MDTRESKWVVVGKDMDGITGYSAVHTSDVREYQSGCYWGGIAKGLSMNKAEIQQLVKELNDRNEPAPENPFRRLRIK